MESATPHHGVVWHIEYLSHILNALSAVAQFALKNTNARFRDHGDARRRSIVSIFPIMAGKTFLFALAFPVTCAVVGRHEAWSGALVSRSQLCAQTLIATYLFDMTYRRVNAILWVHHMLSIGVCVFFMTITTPDAPDIGRLWLAVPMTLLGMGVGLTDLGGDVAVLLYYLAPQTVASARGIRMCVSYLIVGRASAWFIVLSGLFRGEWRQLELDTRAVGLITAVLLCWGFAELEEIYAILGMSKKLRVKAEALAVAEEARPAKS
ncbi:hypothetical protein B0H15DRAFT_833606 [Mycena belliarum]|uniref:Uncharacterized protein n=1 Tax=Mycena belliarum TaxID=1033014 RepID=A0AAD6U914_9AGAR|nr:hypothetical protein B0H15DRAFT_833606 [Mycena belliae]